MYKRTKPSRYSERPPRDLLVSIAHRLRIDEVSLLEAVLIGVSDEELIEQGKRCHPGRIVEDAAEIYQDAWDFLRDAEEFQKRALRGCSLELLVLAARQAVLLDDLVLRQENDAKEQAEAKDRVRMQLRYTFDRAVKLRDQARRVLAKIAANDELSAEATVAARAEESGGSLVEALSQLSTFGRKLMADRDPAQRQRVRLYGVDSRYMELIESAGAELALQEAEFEMLVRNEGQLDRKIRWCAGVNTVLMTQIIDAFLGANDLDPSIPFLRPIHHDHLVRRLSRLPPPPRPPALVPKKSPLPKRDSSSSSGIRVVIERHHPSFHGNLGRR